MVELRITPERSLSGSPMDCQREFNKVAITRRMRLFGEQFDSKSIFIIIYLISNVMQIFINISGICRLFEKYPNMGAFSPAEFKIMWIFDMRVKLLIDLNNILFEMLDKLDTESLIKQRRITIPFIREVFAK